MSSSMPKNYERKSNLPPRFAKQKQNHRVQKQQATEVNEANKMNHNINIFPMKGKILELMKVKFIFTLSIITKRFYFILEGGVTTPSVSAWEKPLRSTSPPKSGSMQMVVNSSEPMQSENSSQRSSPHIPRDAVDKALLDGSSPPVNTIIFENTNFKSTPNDVVLKNQFNSQAMKQQRCDKGTFVF